ncbi:hypothetical protein RRG08_020803 [Elysia crispata]|uniref:SAM-dependent MTase RsmB/NOP-type domain-containing protein n=1 Tax=Elysia crispata TaxID=231223 RepID=A0AAE0YR50_9GAST|nr:hypothetical protein RRG08_020803 [Elysia crispata]
MSVQLDSGVLAHLRSVDFKVEDENLDRYLQVLTQPPMFTTLRIDCSCVSKVEAEEKIKISLEKQSCKRGMAKFSMFWHRDFQDCLVLHNRGPNNVEKVEKEVMVDLACGMAILRGADIFIQGIMAAPPSLTKGDAVSVYADLDKKCLKGLTSKYTGRKLFVGNGISQVSRAEVFNAHSETLRGLGVLMTQPVYEAPCLSELSYPWLVPQNLPSIACVHALDPQSGESVLDMCAAPGGKTSHIASLMNYRGFIVALEKSNQRAKKLKQLGLHNVQVFAFDSTKALSEVAKRESGPPFPPATFDRILVDAPCSALGQRPCCINIMPLKQLGSYPVIQHRLLMVAADLLKPGGVLVYSTCTITSTENEEQVAKFLVKRPDMQLVAPHVQLGKCGLQGSQLTASQRSMVQRFDPGVLVGEASFPREDLCNVDTIGFFIAKFVKTDHKEDT